MSLASAGLIFVHRTRTQRDANAGTLNDAGAVQAPDWQDHLTGQPCRFWTSAGREQIDATTNVVAEDMRMLVPLGTDVTEQDQIVGVCYRDEFIAEGPIGIRAVLERKDHLELVLVRIA